MNLPIPTTIVGIVIACLLAGLIVLRVVADIRAVLRSRKLFRILVTVGKKKTLQSFSVIVELSEKAEHIIPLLDHLYGHQYRPLQIIVIVKHTAGKNAIATIERYRRKTKVTGLRIIKHKAGLNTHTTVQKYASGKVILLLAKDQRLSDNFLNDISLDFAIEQQSIIIPQTLVRPDHSIASALRSIDSLWKRFTLNVHVPIIDALQPLSPGVVYSKKLMTRNLAAATTKMSERAYINTVNQPRVTSSYLVARTLELTQLLHKPIILFLTIIFLLLIAGIAYIVPLKDFLLLLSSIGILYTALVLSFQFETKGYSAFDRINLILLTPFSFIFTMTYTVVATVLALTHLMILIVTLLTKKRR